MAQSPQYEIVVQTERKWGCLAFLLVFVVGLFVGFYATERQFRNVTELLVKSDTTYVYDTTRIVMPPVISHIHTTDTMLVVVSDTLVLHDTTYLVLQNEVKEYKGEEYYAKVSGYRPSLDYIEVYPRTTIITNTERQKNSLSIGVDAGYMRNAYMPIYIEYERMLHKNFDISARILYDMPSKSIGAEIGAAVNIGW